MILFKHPLYLIKYKGCLFMIVCEICKKEFKNNHGGNLTVHIKELHKMTMEEYVVLIKYNGVPPKCECGVCNEKPFFRRGKFSKYALDHNNYKWIEEKYIEIYNTPICKNCGKDTIFFRGKPRKFCSSKCAIGYNGGNWNQNKIKNTVKRKYGVDNVFQNDKIKIKSEETSFKKYGVTHFSMCEDFIKKFKVTSREKYGVDYPIQSEIVKEKVKISLMKKYGVDHFSKTQKFREMSSKNMCKYNENIIINHKIKRYEGTDLYYQSLYELRFIEFCKKNGLLKVLYNSPTFKFLEKQYGNWHLPDFKFRDNYIIEIKSTYWMNKQGGLDIIRAKKESVEKLGYIYVFMLDEDYTNFLNIFK